MDIESILLGNFQRSLDLYQKSLVWAMTASAVFFLLTLNMDNPRALVKVPLPYGQMSMSGAWFVSLSLFVVLGVLALSALKNVETIFARMRLTSAAREALLLYPSLATNPNSFIRIGTALFPLLAVWISFAMEVHREHPQALPHDMNWWIGAAGFCLISGTPFALITHQVWNRLRPTRKKGKGTTPLVRTKLEMKARLPLCL